MDSTKFWIGLNVVFAVMCGINAVQLARAENWLGAAFQAAITALNVYFAYRGVKQLRSR